jgi:DNA-directed RNA polymerase specialized sigma24 family protein
MKARVEEALRSLKAGKPQDVERALATLQEVVYGFGMKVCGVREDAEDTAQETLLRG